MREALAALFLTTRDRRSWFPAIIWMCAALVSVGVAVAVAVQPGQLRDLHQVREWLQFFDTRDANPYVYFSGELDYPPVALLLLWPLAWIPEGHLAAWFLPMSIATTVVAGWAFITAVGTRLGVAVSTPEKIATVGIILAGGAARGAIWLGQTVSLAVLCGALALLWSRRRPFLAAVMLALCSFKPHLAVGFGIAVLLIDGIDVPVIASAIVVSLSLLVAAAMNQSLLAVLLAYARNLSVLYDGPERVRGLLSVRWALDDTVGYEAGTAIYVLLAIGVLAMLGAAARRRHGARGDLYVVAAALIWPLLFLPSQLYNSLLAAPAIWLLRWPETSLFRSTPARTALVGAIVLFGVVDLPRVLRAIAERAGDMLWLFQGSYLLSPLRMALLLAFVLYAAFQRAQAPETET